MDQLISQLLGYLRGVWNRRWLVLALAWPICLAGWAWVGSLPDQYKASARVYVDTESLLAPLMSGLTIQPRVEERLQMVTRTLLSRPNLEEVARRADLDLKARSPHEMEALLDHLREQILLGGGGRQNLYSISYTSENPDEAARVVQSMLDLFVESNLQNSRQDIDASQQFIAQRMEELDGRLSDLNSQIQQFERENPGLLGRGGADAFFQRLEQARGELEAARLDLLEAERRRDSYRAQLRGTEPVVLVPPTPAETGNASTAELDARIESLQSELDRLMTRYTDRHPDVVTTEGLIEQLKARRERILESSGSAPGQDWSASPEVSQYLQGIQLSLADAESAVASLSARVDEYRKRVESLEQKVQSIPDAQARHDALLRERERLQQRYDELRQRQDTAILSEQLQAGPSAVDFRVVDPPFVPSDPIGPNRMLLASGVLGGGLAAGLGMALLLSQIRRPVDSVHDVHNLTDRPLLGCISVAQTPAGRRRQRLGFAAYATGTASLFGAYGAVALYFIGS